MKQKLLNKLWLRVGMIVAIMTTALAGTAWAAEESVTFSEQGYSNADAVSAYTGTKLSIAFTDGSTPTAYYTTGSGIRLYGGGSATFSVENATITEVALTFSTASYAPEATTVWSCTNGSGSGTKGANATWTGSAESVTITRPTGSGHWRLQAVTVTYSTGGSSAVATTTTINASGITNTDVYTSTAAGSLSATVTANGSAVSGATVTWESSDEDVATIDASTGAVTLVGAGTVTFTATYAGVSGTYNGSTATYEMTVTDSSPFTGGDVTFDATKDKGNTTAGTGSIEKNGVTFSCDNGILGNGTEYRLYKNSTTTFSVSEGTITQIEFTGTSSNPVSGFGSQTGWAIDGNNGTWTGNAASVSFTASGAQVRATKIVVTVDLGATPDPSISADDVNIAYDETSGTITYTLENEVAGGAVTASTTSDWLNVGNPSNSNANGTVALTCATNAGETRTATVTLTYTYNTSETVTKDVTVTQGAAPVIYTTIPDLFAAATSTETDVNVTFNDWVVSGVSTNGKNVFITDNAGNGFVIFDKDGGLSATYAVGNILSGTALACKLVLYNGFAEITNLDATDLTISSGGSVTTSNVAMANLTGVNTGALVSYNNLTCSISNNKYYLTDGTTTLQVYNALYAFDALEDGKTYNITGVYQQYNNTKEILPRSAADIEEVVITTPSITVDPDLVELDAEEHDGTLDLTYENLTIGDMNDFGIQYYNAEGEETSEPDWIEVLVAEQDPSVGEGYVVSYYMVENEGEARTAYFKVFAMGDEDFVYSNLVTVNQAAPVAPATGDKYVKVTSTADLTDGQYLIVYEDGSLAFDGNLETLDATGNTISVTISNNEIAATTETTAAEFTIEETEDGYSIKSTSGLYIGQTSDANGLKSSDTEIYANAITFSDNNADIVGGGAYMRYNATSGQERFRYFKSATYTNQKAIQLYKKVEEPITVTVGSALYTTFVAPANVSFPNDVTAYIVTSMTDTSIHLEEIKNVPEDTPVIVKATAAGTYTLTPTDEADDVTGNLLLASNGTVTGGQGIYALAQKNGNVGFYPVASSVTIPAGKAYLKTGVDVKGYVFDFDDNATSIEMVNGQSSMVNGQPIYNLAGQRLNKIQKGINIVNGKKILK